MTVTSEIPQIDLNNGTRMPVLGFGVYQIPAEETEQAHGATVEVCPIPPPSWT